MGILNYENKKVSGEFWFLRNFFAKRKWAKVVVFDIGAHSGEYAVMARRLSKTAEIFSFEPHPVAFEKLKQNAIAYGFTAFPLGCGDRPGKFKFYDYKNSCSSPHTTFCKDVIEKLHGSLAKESEAEMVKLDDFVLCDDKVKVKKINLLKIDTEGYEFRVLKGAERLIHENLIDVIQFEFNEMNIISRVFFRDFYDFLPNYNFYRLLPDGLIALGRYAPTMYEIFASQNIVAIRKDLKLDF